MAYIKTEQVREIRNTLKEKFPEIKFSVRKERNSSIHVNIMKTPYDFSYIKWYEPDGHTSLNRYHLPEGEHKNLFEDILNTIQFGSSNKWFDKSDSQSDYFYTAFYIHMGIGNRKNGYQRIDSPK